MSLKIVDYDQKTKELLEAFEQKFTELEWLFLDLQRSVAKQQNGGIRELANACGKDYCHFETEDPLLFFYYYTYPDPLGKSDIDLIEQKIQEYINICGSYAEVFGP